MKIKIISYGRNQVLNFPYSFVTGNPGKIRSPSSPMDLALNIPHFSLHRLPQTPKASHSPNAPITYHFPARHLRKPTPSTSPFSPTSASTHGTSQIFPQATAQQRLIFPLSRLFSSFFQKNQTPATARISRFPASEAAPRGLSHAKRKSTCVARVCKASIMRPATRAARSKLRQTRGDFNAGTRDAVAGLPGCIPAPSTEGR